MRFVWVICLVVICLDADAQVLRMSSSAATACGGCVSVMPGLGSLPDNPAALAQIKTPFLCFDAANGYLLPAFTEFVAGGVMAVTGTTLSITVSYSGDAFFNETTVSAGASKALFGSLSTGVRLKYHNLFQGQEYARIHRATADVGLIWEISDKAAFGLYMYNPFSISISSDSPLTGISGVATGVLFHTGPHSLVVAEIEKLALRNLNFKAGMEWSFAKRFCLRCGVQSATRIISFGCGFFCRKVRVNIAITNSMIPGTGFSMGTIYEFSKL